jgi:hypothetical protein
VSHKHNVYLSANDIDIHVYGKIELPILLKYALFIEVCVDRSMFQLTVLSLLLSLLLISDYEIRSNVLSTIT